MFSVRLTALLADAECTDVPASATAVVTSRKFMPTLWDQFRWVLCQQLLPVRFLVTKQRFVDQVMISELHGGAFEFLGSQE